MSKIYISKLDAAKRQLESAIQLFFKESDNVTIHSLSANSLDLLRDLGKKQKIQTMFESKMLPLIKPERRKESIDIFRKPQNFFKHADKGTDKEIIEFNPEVTEFFLLDASLTYELLTNEKIPLMKLYTLWFYTKHKDVILDEKYKENIENIEKILDYKNKSEFLTKVLPAIMLEK